jgi:hypothetical protein
MEWKNAGRDEELVCEHGVGHPSLKRAFNIAKMQTIKRSDIIDKSFCDNLLNVCSIHGCDGCCSREDFPGRHDKPEFDALSAKLEVFLNKKWR